MPEIDELLTKYFREEPLTRKEESVIDIWKQASPENQKAFLKLKQYWELKNHGSNGSKVKVWQKISTQLPNQPAAKEVRISRKNWWGIAAATITLFMISIFLLNQSQSEITHSYNKANDATSFLHRANKAGEKRTLKLSDGTTVILNSLSSLRFPEKFGEGKREVFLAGEAFFDVEEDSLRPFIVHSGDLITEVKGTSFNIKAFSDSTPTEVAVVTGKVQVSQKSADTTIQLTPTQKGVLKEGKLEKDNFHPDEIAWIEGKIVFKNANMGEITSTLEKWYGVKFQLKKRVAIKGGYNGTFQEQSLKNILESISYTGSFSFQIEEKKVIIY